MTSPVKSSGQTTSTPMTGSSRMGPAPLQAALNAIDPAILKAISEESTSWYEPSIRETVTSTTG